MKNRRKKNILFIVILLVAFLGIGYAYLTTNLKITGANGIEGNNWDVHWDNVQVTTGSVSGDQVTTAPTISNDGTAITYHIRLKEPGEFYEFTVDAVNAGTVDAMIETIIKNANNSSTIPTYINYSVKYAIGIGVEEAQLLHANSSETYVVRVEYRTDINPEDLPATPQSLSLSLEIEYVQAEYLYAQEVDNYIYTTKNLDVYWGQPAPTGEGVFSTADEAIDSWDYDMFIRSKIENDIVQSSAVGFVINGRKYYIDGGRTDLYNTNKEKLENLFDEENCHEYPLGTRKEYSCSNGTIRVNVESDGGVYVIPLLANQAGWGCIVEFNNDRTKTYGYCGTD